MIMLSVAHEVVEDVPKVALSPHAEESSYAVARLLMEISEQLLDIFGLGQNETLFTWVYATFVFLVSFAIGLVLQWFIVLVVRAIAGRMHSDIYKLLVDRNFFVKACRIVPAIVFLILLQFTLGSRQTLLSWLSRLTWVYVVYIVGKAVSTIAFVVWRHIDSKENTRRLPLKGVMQLVKGVVWIVAIIIIIAILFDKSPARLLAGLGAFAAVLMLIFKDSILGLVAGVQLSENDSLHVGDWIKVNGTDANGTVTEVTLTSVKVLNWDKTVTTLPPYSLVSGSFTNYRTMQQSNTRRIQRVYMIDADSVVQTTERMLDRLSEIPLISDWISRKRSQRAAGKIEDANNSEGLVDGTIDTNLGVFRAYVKLYLDAHPRVDHSGGLGFCFVTTLTQTSAGIPLQIYCFTNTSAWIEYEAIQASIFEHLAATLSLFNLYTFENPSGRDTILDGYISPGKNPDVLFGLPYPFFNNSGTPDNPAYPPQRSAWADTTATQVATPPPDIVIPPVPASPADPDPKNKV